MKKIYIDSDFCVHLHPAESLTEVETESLDAYCDEFILGIRYVPSGKTWISPFGVAFRGECWMTIGDYTAMQKAQADYEHEQLNLVTADRDNLLSDIAALIEEVYTMDSEMMS